MGPIVYDLNEDVIRSMFLAIWRHGSWLTSGTYSHNLGLCWLVFFGNSCSTIELNIYKLLREKLHEEILFYRFNLPGDNGLTFHHRTTTCMKSLQSNSPRVRLNYHDDWSLMMMVNYQTWHVHQCLHEQTYKVFYKRILHLNMTRSTIWHTFQMIKYFITQKSVEWFVKQNDDESLITCVPDPNMFMDVLKSHLLFWNKCTDTVHGSTLDTIQTMQC